MTRSIKHNRLQTKNMTPSSNPNPNPNIIDGAIHEKKPELSSWQAVSLALGMQGMSIAADSLSAGLPAINTVSPELVVRALREHGCVAQIRHYALKKIPSLVCPALLWTKAGSLLILLEAINATHAKVIMPDLGADTVQIELKELHELYSGVCVLFKAKSQTQSREPDWMATPKEHWLWRTLWSHKAAYIEAALATILINVLTLGGTFYTMTVYDRVIPNNAFATLWVLSIGLVTMQTFEFAARMIRAYLVDEVGKKTDLVLGMKVFSQALATRLEHAPQSSGTYANLLREYETVRDFFTSLTLTLIADIPFVFLFIFVMAFIAPPLALVPIVVAPLMILVALLAQWPLATLMRQKFGDSSQRQGMLIEALENLETVKATRAEGYLQGLWESMSASLAIMSKKTNVLSNWVNNTSNFLQQTATVALMITGAYLISTGHITQGALVGCMTLIGRTLSPLSQIVGLGLRFQQVKVAMKTLDKIMSTPVDRSARPIGLENPQGRLELRDVSYAYSDKLPNAIKSAKLTITPGERVVILGRVGSGKSTLLRLLAGLYRPNEGTALLDGLNIAQIEPSNTRRAIGFAGQDARLFYGTLIDNLALNRPEVSEENILTALNTVQLMPMVNAHPMGLGMPVGEHGRSLSGGQRQLVALARALATRPKVLLLDEPTSAMDEHTEQLVLRSIDKELKNVTMVISTHRHSLLAIATRVIVLDAGVIVLDAPKDQALEVLKKGLQINPNAPTQTAVAANTKPAGVPMHTLGAQP
jgi:ATP-binding cassette, subfamily C, bacterial LapB